MCAGGISGVTCRTGTSDAATRVGSRRPLPAAILFSERSIRLPRGMQLTSPRKTSMISEVFAPQATIASGADLTRTLERFSRRLIGLARVHLGGRLRTKVDPEDVVQSAYKSLLGRYGEQCIGAD